MGRPRTTPRKTAPSCTDGARTDCASLRPRFASILAAVSSCLHSPTLSIGLPKKGQPGRYGGSERARLGGRQDPAADLIALDRFEQGAKIALAEALIALALDDLEKDR